MMVIEKALTSLVPGNAPIIYISVREWSVGSHGLAGADTRCFDAQLAKRARGSPHARGSFPGGCQGCRSGKPDRPGDLAFGQGAVGQDLHRSRSHARNRGTNPRTVQT